MKRTIFISITILCLVQGSFSKTKVADSYFDAALKYGRACAIVTSNYVDSVSADSITAKALEGMMSSLDPYSRYLTKEQVKLSNELLFDGFEGIGVRLNIENDTAVILQVVKDSPSDKAGVKPCDKLLFADTVSIAGVDVNLEQLQKLIRGPKGSVVNLTLLRGADTLKVLVKRDKIENHGISDYFMLTSEIGFVRVDCFSENAGCEFNDALFSLSKNGASKFILDFRGNGGGLLSEAVKMLGCLLPAGTELYTAMGNHSGVYTVKSRKQSHMFLSEPLVVLIDSASASASEVFAGALQDWKRATVVGWRSYGKNTVQQSYPLGDGSELRLTVARYYTPSGGSVEGGITPDVAVEANTDSMSIPKCYYLKNCIRECRTVKVAVKILENK